jgi:hypothetical protein
VESRSRILNVGGAGSFDARRWRDALLCHIHRVWENSPARPYLDVGGVTIELDVTKDEYVGYGKPQFSLAPTSETGAPTIVVEAPTGPAVRDALGRFARSKEHYGLTIYFRSSRIELWRTPGSDLLGCAAVGLPEMRLITVASAPQAAESRTPPRRASSGSLRTPR